ncbi:hypothetical protein SDC9_81074 [bioreactor metagenome]|uniref:Uncharacterized protein n=1 Tax=bioreactor metagenome TaxID=1076179 RepID=A0A644Z3B2_9ZZZZ
MFAVLEQRGHGDHRGGAHAAGIKDRLFGPRHIGHEVTPAGHMEMGLGLNQLGFHDIGEAGHYRQDHNQHRDPKHHADHGNQRDDRYRVAPGSEITQRQKQFCPHLKPFSGKSDYFL